LYEAIVRGDARVAVDAARATLDAGSAALEIVNSEMVPAMDEVGRRFDCEEYFVPQLLLSARAMKGALDLLRPLLASTGAHVAGRVVIGTVKGDLHDIGKNIVAAMLEGAGFDVLDLGVDVAPERFVETVRTARVGLVCLSALLTTTMPAMATTIDALCAAELRGQTAVIVGGAPVTERFAREIGADAYGNNAVANAVAAVALARRLAVAHEPA
jgi:methylmalonyl-CoA mutase cobalamin-binding domain/chain